MYIENSIKKDFDYKSYTQENLTRFNEEFNKL